MNTFKKRLRSILAISGIALTSAAMVTLFGIEIGLHQLVESEIDQANARDVVTVHQRNIQQIRLDAQKISDIQSISGVSQVGQMVGLAGNASYHGITLDMPLYGISTEYFSMGPITTVAGSLENQPTDQNVVVSSKVLQAFGIEQSTALGKKISVGATITPDYDSSLTDGEDKKVKPSEYTIVGVVDRGALPVIYIPIEQLNGQGVDSVAQLRVRVSAMDKVASVRETIEQKGLQTESVLDTIDRINQLFKVIGNILIIFGIIVFAITVSGTFTIITLTLMEETRQIGFLRILGLRRRDIRLLFVIQSIILTSLGALGGITIGIVAGEVVNGIVRSIADTAMLAQNISLFIIPVQQVIIILMLSILVGWAVGIVPAKRAAMINPLKELEM